MVGFALARAELDEQEGEHGGGVVQHVFLRAGCVHVGGAVEQRVDVDACHVRAEEAYWREDAESAAYAVWDG